MRILHISDLHAKADRERESWRRRRVLVDAWLRNLDALLEEAPFELVLFTGDAADWGRPEEFDEAAAFLHETIERLKLPRERLFVIPGNHDVCRNAHAETWARLRNALASTQDLLAVGRWFSGYSGAPPGFEACWREQVSERLAAYRHWVEHQLGLPHLARNADSLGYRRSVELPCLLQPVHILGLNTAWMCGDDNDAFRLWILEQQLMTIATDEDGRPLSGLRLLLMHHPFEQIADGAVCRRSLTGHVDLVLRGHLHETELETWSDPDRTLRQLASGCLYEGSRADQWPNSCNAISITCDASGRPSEVEVRFRTWSPRNLSWNDDNTLYKDVREGRLRWKCAPPPTPDVRMPRVDPWRPAVPPVFVGRDVLRKRLQRAWEEGRSVSLVGDWRIGKSSILITCFEDIAQAGRPVRLLNGEAREGQSHGAFVYAATSLPVALDCTADAAADVLARWAGESKRPGLLPVLLVDEFDALIHRFDYRFFERLRGMLDDICLGVSSRREIDRVYQDLGRGASPFQNKLELFWIGLLEPDAADLLIAKCTPGALPRAHALVREWAGRHPFFIQLLARKIIDAQQFGQPLEDALNDFQTEAAARLRELWKTLEARDRNVLVEAAAVPKVSARTLKLRGLLDENGRPFGRVLTEWLCEEGIV
jgi:predicted MPP superfamily phosphohydrolase